MTDLPGGLDGGLDEPEELQPAEGSLRLVGDGDAYDAAAWEAATAAVLRKARRLGDDAPDSDVWAALTPHDARRHRRRTDRAAVRPRRAHHRGRPARPGAWDVRTRSRSSTRRPPTRRRCRTSRTAPPRCTLHLSERRSTTGPRCSTACCSTWRRSPSSGPRTEQVGGVRRLPRGRRGRRCTPATTSPSTSRRSRCCRSASASRTASRLATCSSPIVRRALPARRPRARRRRHGAARRGSQRRAGARLGHGDRRRLPPPPRRRRLLRRAGARTDRVPPRRHRRAVPDHRQAAGGPPAVGPRARGVRGRRCR